LESGGDTTWFLRFRDLADEGFEAFYLDVEPASDGSEDVIFVDGGWATFTLRSGSGGSGGSLPDFPLASRVFDGSATANNLEQEGGIDIDGLTVFCGHEYDDGELVGFRVELNREDRSFDYIQTFQGGETFTTRNGEYNPETGQLSYSSASASSIDDSGFYSEWTLEFSAVLIEDRISGTYVANNRTIYTVGGIMATCTSVFDLNLTGME